MKKNVYKYIGFVHGSYQQQPYAVIQYFPTIYSIQLYNGLCELTNGFHFPNNNYLNVMEVVIFILNEDVIDFDSP